MAQSKMRIAYLIDTVDSDKGGTEKQLLNLITRLDRDRFEVKLICLHQSDWMAGNSLPCEVACLDFRGFLKADFPAVLRSYLRLMERERFDLVQTFFEEAMFIGYLGKLFSRRRHTLVVSRRDLGLGSEEPHYHRIYRKIKPALLRSVDAVAANAHAIKEHMVRYERVPADKIVVIGNAVDLPEPPKTPPPLFLEHRADLWVGLVANIKPVKRIDLLLQALAQLKRESSGLEARAVIIGDDYLQGTLQRLADSLSISDRTHFVGTVANVSDYLHYLDVGVLCSDKEGLSNSILEYMSCGLPVVATAVGGNGEMVDDSNGVCVPAGDASALAQAIRALAASPARRERLGVQSKKKVLENYTWQTVLPQWEHFYSCHHGMRGER